MTDESELNMDPALYARWCSANLPSADTRKPTAIDLAAYVDGRADMPATDLIETALAEDPFLLAEFIAARRVLPSSVVSQTLLDRAKRLVPVIGEAYRLGRVIPFHPVPANAARGLSGIVAWGALAASILVVSMVGFNLGVATQQAIEQPPGATPVDLLEQVDPAIG